MNISKLIFACIFCLVFSFHNTCWGMKGSFARTHLNSVDSIIHHAYQTIKKAPPQGLQLFTANEQKNGYESLSLKELKEGGQSDSRRRWISPPNVNIYATYSAPWKETSTILDDNKAKANALANLKNYLKQFTKHPEIKNVENLITQHENELDPKIIENYLNRRKETEYDIRLIHLATISIAQTLEKYNFQPKIKWPNDILLNGKKLCGVSGGKYFICEGFPIDLEKPVVAFIMLNFSLNVNMDKDACSTVSQPATSMAIEIGKDFDKEEVLQELSKTLLQNLEKFQNNGMKPFLSYLKSHALKFGQEVEILSTIPEDYYFPDVLNGIFKDINNDGDMVLTIKDENRVIKYAHLDPSLLPGARELYRYFSQKRQGVLETENSKDSSFSFSSNSTQNSKAPITLTAKNNITPVTPPVWYIEELGDLSTEVHPSFEEARTIELLINKLVEDNHFKTINFFTNKVAHSDGRGFLWLSKDKAFAISARMGDIRSSHSQFQADHVKILAYNRVVDKFGKMINIDQVNNNEQTILDSHIPIIQWLRWPLWFSPTVPVDIKELQTFLNPAPETPPKTESFPVNSQQPKPLVTPLPENVGFKDKGITTEERKPQIEAFPEAQQNHETLITLPHVSQGTEILIQKSEEGLGTTEHVRGSYHIPPKILTAFPNAVKVKEKTVIQNASKKRRRWKDDAALYEWDYRHGTVEKYDLRGKHLGEFDPLTGKLLKPADPTRKIEP